jgi:hypothetical protein
LIFSTRLRIEYLSISTHNSTALISQGVSAGFQASSVQLSAIQTKVDGISTEFANTSLRQEQQSAAIQTTAQRIESVFDTMQTRTGDQLLTVTSTLNESAAASREEHQSMKGMCSLILDVLGSLQSTMASQDEKTGDILRQLREQAEQTRSQNPNHKNNGNYPARAVSGMTEEASAGKVLGDVEVLDSIARLCNLTDYKDLEHPISTEDVHDIIGDLKMVLRAAQELSETPSHQQSLKRARGVLDTAKRLSLNQVGE